MPKYRATGVVTGGKHLGFFEAANEAEAREKAMESDECYVSLCHQCSGECEDPEIHEIVVSRID